MLYEAKNFRRDYEATSIRFRFTYGPMDPAQWTRAHECDLERSGAQYLFTDYANGHETVCYGWL